MHLVFLCLHDRLILMTYPLQPFRDSKHLHIRQSVDSHFNEKFEMVAELC